MQDNVIGMNPVNQGRLGSMLDVIIGMNLVTQGLLG
jgi:hypothetical protein